MNIIRHFTGQIRIRLCEQCLIDRHHGIKLADANSNETDDDVFAEKTKQALDLIRDLDPKRFARIQRHIDYICNAELYSGANYGPGNVCNVDFGRFDFAQHPEWNLYMYAATLVHEATHGHLRAKGIGRNRRNWVQVERICRAEENRFLSRIDSPWGSELQKPFNPSDWNFGSLFDRAKEMFRRMKEEKGKAQQPPASGYRVNAQPDP